MKTKLFLFLVLLSVPLFAVNDLSESFNGAYDLGDWSVSNTVTFSPTTLDLGPGGAGNEHHGVFLGNFGTIGSGGSWSMETVWTNLGYTGTSGDNEITTKVKLDSGSDTDFRLFSVLTATGITFKAQIWDNTSTTMSVIVPDLNLAVTPTDLTTYMELTVNGPGDWQMDFYYDIGGGKTLIGSLDETDLGGDSLFDPTTANFRPEFSTVRL